MGIRTWLRNWLLKDDSTEWSGSHIEEPKKAYRQGNGAIRGRSIAVKDDSVELDSDNTIRFTVVRAAGGYVVQCRRYDTHTDCNHNNLHLISDGEDFSLAIGKIVTMESMR
jgi:hypothetical protein